MLNPEKFIQLKRLIELYLNTLDLVVINETVEAEIPQVQPAPQVQAGVQADQEALAQQDQQNQDNNQQNNAEQNVKAQNIV